MGPSEFPFIHTIEIKSKHNSDTTKVKALFDSGAMVSAMCSSVFSQHQHLRDQLKPSTRILRVANGATVRSEGTWYGFVAVGPVIIETEFEVFPSGGAWSFLLGKPLLRELNAVQAYRPDVIIIQNTKKSHILYNQCSKARVETTDEDDNNPSITLVDSIDSEEISEDYIETFNIVPDDDPDDVYTRKKPAGPFNPKRVERVLREVKIGSDLTEEERQEVEALLKEFADVFALSVNEVHLVDGATHKLNIDPNIKFKLKVHQKHLSPPQTQYLHEKIDEMLAAEVIEPIHPRDVKFAAPTVLAQKAHSGDGLSHDELKYLVNKQCVDNGHPSMFDVPKSVNPPPPKPVGKPKWRICQNYSGLNKFTEIAPMPQGDIRAKQQRLSGHRFISTIDFASGFYAVAIDKDSRPYICFYIEGRGYFCYKRMPFGLTGAPSEFAHMTAQHLHDLVVQGILELFVDDGGSAADTFSEGIEKLRAIFQRCRERKLSISAQKCQLFQTEGVFAGATVSPSGVRPDRAKLTAIVEWPQPETAQQLDSFLGLTGWFRDLIENYARKEGPLRDLLQLPKVPHSASKSVYQRILSNFKLREHWEDKHTNAFMNLKAILLSDSVLRAPKFDGSPFTLTTDGSKEGFAGVITQEFETTAPSGRKCVKTHPVGFASKRTSKTEAKYQPFLLEFAALKFSLDHFSDILWGSPIKLRTDCQALRDTLLSDKLNATHARWRDGVTAYNIIDVQHLPGRLNAVADPLSRQWTGREKTKGDGSEWTVAAGSETQQGLAYDVLSLVSDTDKESLLKRFAAEPLFRQVLEALFEIEGTSTLRERQRAKHRAKEYFVADGKLWRIGGGTPIRGVSKRECVTRSEARELARVEHEEGGHWHRDAIKLALMDKIHSPRLDESIISAIVECPKCKNFGGMNLHALMNPITRRHPFELLVGDYLSLPVGKGKWKTVLLILDCFSQHSWAYKHKTAGSGKTTNDGLQNIFHNFQPPEAFMTDGGPHFKCQEVANFCESWGVDHHVVAAYSPWINGLVEGTNKLLIYILARLCAPELGEDKWATTKADELPSNWPDLLDRAIRILNWRVLPALKFSPKELLLSKVVNTPRTDLTLAADPLTPTETETHMAYVAQQRLDGYAEAVKHAIDRKTAFDKRVLKSKAGVVSFEVGQLVQVFRSDLFNTLKSERKLTPSWSPPRRIRAILQNSYLLEDLNGDPIEGEFNARRLREFTPRPGTQLAEAQRRVLETAKSNADERKRRETERIEAAREEDLIPSKPEVPKWRDWDGARDREATEEEQRAEREADTIARRRGRRHLLGGQDGVGDSGIA